MLLPFKKASLPFKAEEFSCKRDEENFPDEPIVSDELLGPPWGGAVDAGRSGRAIAPRYIEEYGPLPLCVGGSALGVGS